MSIGQYLSIMLNDEERKPLYKIVKESLHCALIEKEIPYYYFTSLLYKKGADDYRDYIGFKKVYNIINDYYYRNGKNAKLEDKIVFEKILTEHQIDTPIILATNENFTLEVDGRPNKLTTIDEFKYFLAQLLSQSRSQSIFVKPVNGEGGVGSFRYDRETIKDNNNIIALFSILDKRKFIFQETIVQHPKINDIYSNSINTIRIHTYKNENNDVEIVSALMRVGHGGAIVDNGSSGGFFVSVDIDEWMLNGNGKTYLKSGAKTFRYHPDSHKELNGFQLPFLGDTHKLVIGAAKLFSEKFIGWDVALTEKGPVIVEANGGPHVIMLQMECGGIKSHPRYREIFAEYI